MLIEFRLGNFRSFKEKKNLSLEATAITEHKESVSQVGGRKLLKSAVLYGANSSGKTSFLAGIQQMKELVLTSAEKSSTARNDLTPFLLNTSSEKKPSFFEIVFLVDGTRYRYGFEMDSKKVHGEWLFEMGKRKEEALFIREGDAIAITKFFKEGEGLESKTRDNALFLSVVDQFNGEVAKKLLYWFFSIGTMSELDHHTFRSFTLQLFDGGEHEKRLKLFLRDLDLGFDDLRMKQISQSKGKIQTIHPKYDDMGKVVGHENFDAKHQESSGTNKVFDLVGPVFATLIQGGVLVIDELDSKLHPLMTAAIVNLFNSKEHNQKNAQLIFATHDTNLLTYGKLRRDQIYFVEKDKLGASDLYSLIEYREEDDKKVRKDRSFEKDYIMGRYGAIPFIGDFDEFLAK